MTDSPLDCGPVDVQPADYRPFPRPMESTRLARSDAAALADLQLHWGSAYVIGLDGDIWSATFHGSADELRAHTSAELRTLIRADYSYRQQAGPSRRGGRPRGEDEGGRSDVPEHQPAPHREPVIRGERMSL